jgi:hypothetical protein
MILSFLLWGGLVFLVLGLILLLMRRTRRLGARTALAAVAAMVLAVVWPSGETRIAVRQSRIDDFMPVWQFSETHTTHVNAPPERTFASIRPVTVNEIFLFQTLIAIRRMGRPAPPSIMNAPENEPLLHVATRTSFRYLADEPPREMVLGTRVAPNVVAVMNFLVTPDGRGGSNLSTETRVLAKDDRSRRGFAVYWRIIHPGSDIIRRSWLRAIRKRAESS